MDERQWEQAWEQEAECWPGKHRAASTDSVDCKKKIKEIRFKQFSKTELNIKSFTIVKP